MAAYQSIDEVNQLTMNESINHLHPWLSSCQNMRLSRRRKEWTPSLGCCRRPLWHHIGMFSWYFWHPFSSEGHNLAFAVDFFSTLLSEIKCIFFFLFWRRQQFIVAAFGFAQTKGWKCFFFSNFFPPSIAVNILAIMVAEGQNMHRQMDFFFYTATVHTNGAPE